MTRRENIYLQSDIEILQAAIELKSAGKFSEAERLLLELIAAHPDFAAAYNSLGAVYFVQGDLDKAEQAYRAAIECQASYTDAYYNLGLTLARLHRDREAAVVYQALLELLP